MKSYIITIEIDGDENVQSWYGWDEKTAISQAMLSNAQDGARSIKVVEIIEK